MLPVVSKVVTLKNTLLKICKCSEKSEAATKSFLRSYTNFTGKLWSSRLLLIKLQTKGLQLYQKKTPALAFSREICKI